MNQKIAKIALTTMAAAFAISPELYAAIPASNPAAASTAQAAASASTEVQVYDIFNRAVNTYGIDLVDWQGYIANPYVKLTVKPPEKAAYPITVTIKAQGSSRLMMDLPSTLSATGATKTLTFSNASQLQSFLLEIAPDRVGGPDEIENYTLSLTVKQNDGTTTAQNIPIRVLDQDDNKEPSLPLVFDYRYDTVNHYFDDEGTRKAAEQAVKDWFYFFDEKPYDTVAAGAETNYIPNDQFSGHTLATNNAAYNGEWIFFRGLNGPYSTGWPANNGSYHKRNGVEVPGHIHRSIGTALDFYDDAVPFTSLNDDDWYKTDLYQVTDVYGLIMHEFGHGVAFSDGWDGMRTYVDNGGNDPEVIAYQGISVPLDSSYHIPGEQKYWDRISGQSAGWTNLFPTRRWMLTKLTLLVAENAGWKLNKNLTPFLAPQIVTASLSDAVKGQAYSQKLTAQGGVPFYDWTIVSGSLPAGLSLDRFTGTISGTVSGSQSQSSFTFTVQLRDYDEKSAPVTKTFTIKLDGSAPTPTPTVTPTPTSTPAPTPTPTPTASPKELVVHYPFNETSGSKASDLSGNGRSAALKGGATWAAGKSGNALSLNGAGAYASLPAGIVGKLNDFTVSAWVKVNANTDWMRIFDFGNDTNSYMFLTPKAEGGGVRFAITTDSYGAEQQIDGPALAVGVWKHVAVTLQGTTGILYVDGKEAGRNDSMTLNPAKLGSTAKNYIGKSQYDDPNLNGMVDDFRIYNRALSASEIAEISE